MTPRELKRLEALIRRARDPASSPGESDTALCEALRVVEEARHGKPGDIWDRTRVMRYTVCEVCRELIKPADACYRTRAVDVRLERYRCRSCHRASYEHTGVEWYGPDKP